MRAVLLAGEGIPNEDLTLIVINQDGEAMAAAYEGPVLARGWLFGTEKQTSGMRSGRSRMGVKVSFALKSSTKHRSSRGFLWCLRKRLRNCGS